MCHQYLKGFILWFQRKAICYNWRTDVSNLHIVWTLAFKKEPSNYAQFRTFGINYGKVNSTKATVLYGQQDSLHSSWHFWLGYTISWSYHISLEGNKIRKPDPREWFDIGFLIETASLSPRQSSLASGLITYSIRLCWLFTIKDQC